MAKKRKNSNYKPKTTVQAPEKKTRKRAIRKKSDEAAAE